MHLKEEYGSRSFQDRTIVFFCLLYSSFFCQVSPQKHADVCERKQAAGLQPWLAWTGMPEKQRPLNNTKTTAEGLQYGPPTGMEVSDLDQNWLI